eukprot:Gregarina_sp_Poly_1__570@NODE_1136_length_4979_cov_138_838966_g448_i1_p5_GENE_NODE_1136_length_4979_cov_138_838966_g448_i1NODE_1136_length_4979_cov_138_838966_g448_i1_p5_ORF_typecomplete_len146_score27_42_NODE_1136_length_4979_cov_138_838966_g448_i115992036
MYAIQLEADKLEEEQRIKAQQLLEEEERRREAEMVKKNAMLAVVNAFLVDVREMTYKDVVSSPAMVSDEVVRKTVPTPGGPGMVVKGVLTPRSNYNDSASPSRRRKQASHQTDDTDSDSASSSLSSSPSGTHSPRDGKKQGRKRR